MPSCSNRLKDLIPIVILTDPIVESKMDEALAQIQALPVIHGEIVRIRLESLDNNRVEEKTLFSSSQALHIKHLIMSNANRYTGLVDRYRDRLPVSATTRNFFG